MLKGKDLATVTSPNPWRFFALALGISWICWAGVILSGRNVFSFPTILLGAIGLFGPAASEILLLLRAHDPDLWNDYWKRVLDIRRISVQWHLVIWLTFPVIHITAIVIGTLFFNSPLPEFETARALLHQPWRIFPYFIFILLFGPLPEELGWRGYALDGLQARYSALASSLILGTVWSMWHIPLFFMQGTFQHDKLGFGSASFWFFMLGPIVASILFTWIYNNTNRSTLSAIFFHFMTNLSGELLPLDARSRFISLLLLILMSAIVCIVWGPSTLKRLNTPKSILSTSGNFLKRFFGKGAYPHQLSFFLTSAARKLILSPAKLANRLELNAASRILEIGPGPGYFSVEIARRLPKGYLLLLDLQMEMLQKARGKILRARLHNVGFTQGTASDLPFVQNSLDGVLMVAVLGEVKDPEKCLRQIREILRPHGWLSITEQPGDPDFLPLSHVRPLVERHGFEFVDLFGTPRNYTVNFRKRA